MSVVPPGLRLACALVLAGLPAACGNQTGILLEIHKDDGVSSEVYALEVFVGLGGRPELFDPAWRVAARLDGALTSVTLDQELGADTYRILLEPDDGLDATDGLIVAVSAPARRRTERIARKAPAALDDAPKWPTLNTSVRVACEAINSHTSRKVPALRTACNR